MGDMVQGWRMAERYGGGKKIGSKEGDWSAGGDFELSGMQG